LRRLAFLLLLSLLGCGAAQSASSTGHQSVKLITGGDERVLRKRPEGSPARSPDRPEILLIALDGVDRNTLYAVLENGEMPNLSRLLGKNAHFEPRLLSTLPSTTMPAWTTAMTGLTPAEHGLTGNEYWIRETKTFACPAPVSFTSAAPTIAIFTDDYLDSLYQGKTVYERMREKDPNLLAWVAMHFVHRGADKLLLAKKSVFVDAFEAEVETAVKRLVVNDKESREIYAKLDNAVAGVVVENLEKGPVPDVLTIYFSGTDLFAHVAEEGPDAARRSYLKEVLDPQIGRVAAKLRERGALDRRFVVVTADHGHTEVPRDDAHAMGTDENKGPVAVLRGAGFKVRPFRREVPDDDDFNAVLAYGGATAYVYVADRSTKKPDWSKPPRWQEDVVPVADAFLQHNEGIDLVLTRHPKPHDEIDDCLEVYLGNGKTMPVDAYLAANPHPAYVRVEERIRDLSAGRYGERAGDVMLLARNGDLTSAKDRYYFAGLYHSWHGSPSDRDSSIPLIVAHPTEPIAPVAAWLETVLGNRPSQQRVTDVLVGLRERAWKK
jgi:hypothetical protein